MGALTDARTALATAVSAGGLECSAYPPDALTPPAAFVDSMAIDFAPGSGFSFCMSGLGSATVITCAQRNDKSGSTQYLEDLTESILKELEGIDGLRVTGVDSGSANLAGSDVPAVIYRVEFGIGIS